MTGFGFCGDAVWTSKQAGPTKIPGPRQGKPSVPAIFKFPVGESPEVDTQQQMTDSFVFQNPFQFNLDPNPNSNSCEVDKKDTKVAPALEHNEDLELKPAIDVPTRPKLPSQFLNKAALKAKLDGLDSEFQEFVSQAGKTATDIVKEAQRVETLKQELKQQIAQLQLENDSTLGPNLVSVTQDCLKLASVLEYRMKGEKLDIKTKETLADVLIEMKNLRHYLSKVDDQLTKSSVVPFNTFSANPHSTYWSGFDCEPSAYRFGDVLLASNQ
jgi:DNA-binding protein YbaB